MKIFFAGLAVIGTLLVGGLGLSPTAYGQQTAAPVRDICAADAAAEGSFCKERQRLIGTDPVKNDSSPILGPSSILYRIIQFVTMLTGALSIIMIIVGGFKYVVSGGDSNATKGAKDTILYAVIGLVIALFAQIIITFVLSSL